MAGSVVLKTFRGGNVTPQNDAIIYQTVIPGAGVFKGCEVTCARGNILHISQGFGMIKGRFFEMYENEVSVQLAETGQTLDGRLYVHMDLSNADEPIKVIAETGETLPALMMDANVNYNNSTYDMELAAFRVDAGGVLDLAQTFPTVQAGGGSGGGGGTGIQRDTMYALGDIVYTGNAPGWCSLVCTQEGTTALAEPVGYTQVKKAGDKVLDGSCVFTARSIFGELDAAAGNLTKTAADLGQLRDEFEQSKSDTADLVFKLMSLEEYAALEDYDSATMYYCYAEGNPAQIRAVYFGGNVIFAAGVTVSYHVDTNTVVKQTASLLDDLVADAPPASLDGYLTPRRQSISMPCSKGRSPSGCLTTALPSLTAGKQKNLTIRSITTTAMPRARALPFPNVRMNGREKLSADGIRTPILIPHTFPDRKGPSAVTATFFRCSWIRSMISLIREVMCRSRSPQTGFMSLSYMGRQAVT